jgi:hypothetical protein
MNPFFQNLFDLNKENKFNNLSLVVSDKSNFSDIFIILVLPIKFFPSSPSRKC